MYKNRNVNFSATILDISLISFCKDLSNDYLFCKYFVRLYAGLTTKDINVKILKMI